MSDEPIKTGTGRYVIYCGAGFTEAAKDAMVAFAKNHDLLIVDEPIDFGLTNLEEKFGEMYLSGAKRQIKKFRNDERARQRARGKFTR